ncbi:MAG: hypothetical protein LQ348_000425 [Seirophora lacunosa]|nr:MAG: hypothetical protein LQ348_000425 [Seirophora lacunosa]
MPAPELDDLSHRRYNPLRGSWILVSPHRTKRPWQINRSLIIAGLSSRFLRAESVTGKCYVVTFAPNHNLTFADLAPQQIISIINTWTDLYTAHLSPTSPLAQSAAGTTLPPASPNIDSNNPKVQYRYMQIFENKGAAMGCSNPHPHGQIWTTTSLPEEPAVEIEQLKSYCREQEGHHMLEDYARLESDQRERIVYENSAFIAVCPWWATWPFETMVIALRHKRALTDFSSHEKEQLAEVLSEVTIRYDNLFETQFPYSMGLHQAPLAGSEEEIQCSHFHIHFYPPLLRSATVRKFLVGYEMMAEPQRDITPEQAAERLRGCGGVLYRTKMNEEG